MNETPNQNHEPAHDPVDLAVQALLREEVPAGPSPEVVSQLLSRISGEVELTSQDKLSPTHSRRFTGMKITASIALFVMVGLIVFSAINPSKAVAFEQVAREILKIETLSFEISTLFDHGDGKPRESGSGKCITKLPGLVRMEMPNDVYSILDFQADKMLMVIPETKTAMLMEDYSNYGKYENPAQFILRMQDHLRRAEQNNNFNDITYEKLGEKEIAKQRVVGFRVLNPVGPDGELWSLDGKQVIFQTIDIWADIETGHPIEIVYNVRLDEHNQVTSTYKNLKYNQPLDPQLFSQEVPEGYTVIGPDLPKPNLDEVRNITDEYPSKANMPAEDENRVVTAEDGRKLDKAYDIGALIRKEHGIVCHPYISIADGTARIELDVTDRQADYESLVPEIIKLESIQSFPGKLVLKFVAHRDDLLETLAKYDAKTGQRID
ncbi:LolA family protein [Bremerella sp. P1]|uniref:LolA family protein n=1 Tax=Bremerella sp. P1 TaxID=3026424 RepID=UPI00236820E4|nr:hypothetical protein [Bremerella sp. P1]WDI42603.1 hypothetical protein PSR63_01415 [Bremerella sp. P1]